MSDPTAAAFLRVLETVLGPADSFVPLHEPRFRGESLAYVTECVETGWVSSAGSYVDRFEQLLATVTGAPYVVATSSGTAALHMALIVAGVRPGDEVFVPALSFVATANAVAHCGAIPHFCDIEDGTLGLCPDALRLRLEDLTERRDGAVFNRETGRRLAAVLPVHIFGHPAPIEALLGVAAEFGLPLVEDAAEALGTRVSGRHVGLDGCAGVLSFNGNKIVTTGGGGALLFTDPELAARAKHLTTTAKLPHRWAYRHDAIGYNYRLPNLNAALGYAQLEYLDELIALKRDLADRYITAFSAEGVARVRREPSGAASNYWLCTAELPTGGEQALEAVLEATNDAGYMTRPAWDLLSGLPMYTASPRAPLPIAEQYASRLICLPSSPHLGEVTG